MGKVIVVTSGKGGVGKTTSTAALGAALARAGQKVVVVDFDVGLRNLDLVMGAERRVVHDLRAGLAVRRGHSPGRAGKRDVAAERAAHGTIARAARKCHAIAATPAASDPHCDAAACGPSSCVASSA